MADEKLKLTDKQKKNWEKKMATYASYVAIAMEGVKGVKMIIDEKLGDGTAKKVLLSLCDAVIAGLQNAYDMLKSAHDHPQDGDFTSEVPFPDRPPAGDSEHPESWFQLAWGIIKEVLNIAAQHSSKFSEIVGPLVAAGDELVQELDKYFGKPKKKALQKADIPASFPALK